MIHVLQTSVTESALSSFCELGGLRVLRLWIDQSIECDEIEILRSIISLLSKIPFDMTYVKQSEIGKAIKKASKLTSNERDVSNLQEETKSLMTLWKEKMEAHATSSSTASNTKVVSKLGDLPAIVKEMDGRLFKKRGPYIPPEEPKPQSPKKKVVVDVKEDQALARKVVVSAENELSKTTSSQPVALISAAAVKKVKTAGLPSRASGGASADSSQSQPARQKATFAGQVKPTSSVSTKQLPTVARAESSSSNIPSSSSVAVDMKDDSEGEEDLPDIVPFGSKQHRVEKNAKSTNSVEVNTKHNPPPKNAVPGPGGMKKSSNRSGLSLQFKSVLVEYKLIEVEKVSRQTTSYRNEKNMARRDKMKEKEEMNQKLRDMESLKIPWTRFDPFLLPQCSFI